MILTGPISPDIFRQAEELAATFNRPLLLSHERPDCDAYGSLVTMRGFFEQRGVQPLALQFNPTPQRYVAVRRLRPMSVWQQDVSVDDLHDVDGIVVLDTCVYNQMTPLADWLRAQRKPTIAIDHHVTRDDLARQYVIDTSASATCLILHDWAKAGGWAVTEEMAKAMYLGIATDTGWFRHANTDARTLRAAADLIERGVVAHELFRDLYQTNSPGRLRLLGDMLQRLELRAGDQLAVLTQYRETREKTGALMSDSEDMINEPLSIEAVRVSVFLVEQDESDLVRLSLRSKPPSDSMPADIDVAAIAQHFGGGGHKRAAGARVQGSLDEVKRRVTDYLLEILKD